MRARALQNPVPCDDELEAADEALSLDAATLPKRAWGFVYYGGVADGEDRVELFYLVRLGLYQVRLEWPIGRR